MSTASLKIFKRVLRPRLTTQAQRPGARGRSIATATLPPGSLQRMVRPTHHGSHLYRLLRREPPSQCGPCGGTETSSVKLAPSRSIVRIDAALSGSQVIVTVPETDRTNGAMARQA